MLFNFYQEVITTGISKQLIIFTAQFRSQTTILKK